MPEAASREAETGVGSTGRGVGAGWTSMEDGCGTVREAGRAVWLADETDKGAPNEVSWPDMGVASMGREVETEDAGNGAESEAVARAGKPVALGGV